MTIKEILYIWLKKRQREGNSIVKNHDMQEVQAFGKAHFNKLHNVSTYEREFRRIRSEWPHRFREINQSGVERAWIVVSKQT